MQDKKYVKVVGRDGYDKVLADGEVIFIGPALDVGFWVASHNIFISDVIEDEIY